MIPCLIKTNRRMMNNKAFSLVELLMAVGFSMLLLGGLFGFYNAANQFYNSGMNAQNLQDGAGIVINKIMQGEAESGTIYRLSTAVSYMIPNGTAGALYTCGGTAQAAACNANNPLGELYYCQDTPCTSSDATARWYYLDSTGTIVYYHHPKAGGGTIEEVLYKATTGSTLTLRFSPASVAANAANVVEIDAALNQNKAANITNKNLAASGSASTYVLLRNHP